MAGVSSPALAAAVSNAGALGSVGVGAIDAQGACRRITATRDRTRRPFNVNVSVELQHDFYTHSPPGAGVRMRYVCNAIEAPARKF